MTLCSYRWERNMESQEYMNRVIAVSPRHEFIRPWIRAYLASGNTIPLAIVPGPAGDWDEDDMKYCKAAAEFCGGLVFDCSNEWNDSRRLAPRAVRNNVGWYTKKSILHAVATRLAPKSWAWIDDDAEVTGSLDECFEAAEKSSGFIFSQFYYPSSIDVRHPERMYRSNIDTGDKICWNSFVIFHGDANERIADELGKDFPVEDDEIVFGHLYANNPAWHDGFCDFSIRRWQTNCKLVSQIPQGWGGKIIHYTTMRNKGEVKKYWASKASSLPPAPFEPKLNDGNDISLTIVDESARHEEQSDPVDAVFVVGIGSSHGNEELRYAMRSLAKNCGFIRDVYICGTCPSFVDRSAVKHLQWPDRFTHAKDANIIDKLRHACEHPGIAKRILFCSDDQFQTRECSWGDFRPRYLRRYSSDDKWYEAKKRVWHTRLRNTLERDAQRRRESGLDDSSVFYFQPHIWMPIDRDSFIAYAKWSGYENRDDTIIASGYYNFVGEAGKQDFDHIFLRKGMTGIPNETHVAYYDKSFDEAIAVARELFPDPCRFEAGATHEKTADVVPSQEKKQDNGLYDPSKASSEELAEIERVSSLSRDTPEWTSLLGEIARAEELRLFGVRGWRVVWRDIISRWKSSTKDGADIVKVDGKRSEEASRVISAYMSDPNSVRTVSFGRSAAWNPSVQRHDGVASEYEMSSLRDRVRMSASGRA